MPVSITHTRTPGTQNGEDPELVGVEEVEVEDAPLTVEGDFNTVLHTGPIFLKAGGSIPRTFTSGTMSQQRNTAAEFHSFLTSENLQPLQLNEGSKVYTALLSIPRSKWVKIVFAPGGSSLIITH